MDITARRPHVIYKGKELQAFDAIIPRIGATHTFYGAAVVRQFELRGTFSANGRRRSRAPATSSARCSCSPVRASDCPSPASPTPPRTSTGCSTAVGGAPVVVKLLEGTQGVGVVLAETKKAAESVIGAFRQLDADILVQEFIKEAGGPTSARSSSATASWRRSSARGTRRLPLEPPPRRHREKIKLTPRSARSRCVRPRRWGSGSPASTPRSNRGPVVLEVNSRQA